MTLEGAEVKMVCEILPYSGGLARNIVQCLDDYGIPLKLSTTVVKSTAERVEATIAKVDEKMRPIKGIEEYVECDTLLRPSDLFRKRAFQVRRRGHQLHHRRSRC